MGMSKPIDTYDTLLNIHAALVRWAAAKEAGDNAAAEAAFDDAEATLTVALDIARSEGFAEGREESGDEGRDPAEDYEPDVSDVGFDAFEGRYTDDC